ncbi:uncharacterized protein IUM83_05021 [Phytophthora cinnamomi]|uniref:uncharacterized protein n=1 Tax=Phytophthora cinnamomi TaxID=4785 RepID=UPI00355ABE3E|nr:hypothetical protein IUM83_05021 [Phytophthora cinnamomi]
MGLLQKSLDTELQKTEESFSRRHCELAAAKNYTGCSELRNAYQKELSSNPQIASLRKELTLCYTDLRASNKAAAEAKDTLAFWEGLLKLCDTVQEQLDAHILNGSTNMENLAISRQDLQWIGSTMIDALGNYFDRSFQVQEAALACIDKMRQIQVEHDAKFGGFIAFDVAGITQYQRVVGEAQQNEKAVVKNLSLLWDDVHFHLPELQHYFASKSTESTEIMEFEAEKSGSHNSCQLM